MKPFPIPVRAIGPGSQDDGDEVLDYITMPKGMETYHAPVLPEPEAVAPLKPAQQALSAVQAALQTLVQDDPGRRAQRGDTVVVSLDALDDANRALVNQVLGEGEVSAQIVNGRTVQIQESVFAGVWRVITHGADGLISDVVEVGLVPRCLMEAGATTGGQLPSLRTDGPVPPGVMNAPAILSELDEQLGDWRVGQPPHVINLTLLPLSPEDVAYLGQRLGVGEVTVLSRGYGNCRVTSTSVPHCWQVVYFNSQDHIILNTIEVTRMPDVVSAAPEDLADSLERVVEVLAWLEVDPS